MADMLASWVQQKSRQLAAVPRQRRAAEPDGTGFAFYWRCSTEEWQDPVTSRQWQWDNAVETIAGKGNVVAEFGDVGWTRRLRWERRPQAAELIKAFADPGREFGAVVIGKVARAFYGTQFIRLLPVLRKHGITLWIPELGGPLDFDNPVQVAQIHELAMHATQEVWNATVRVIGSMKAHTREEGRFEGGRPPYGYRLAPIGPHPNKTFAGWDRKQYALEPDPETAPWARWIFAQRIAGHSVTGIARQLNEMGVPCPSAHDPARNRHRRKDGWHPRTVGEILGNLRYTGHELWNRTSTEHNPDDPKNAGRQSRKDVRRRNAPDKWVISIDVVHEPLVSEQDFIAVQKVRAVPQPRDGSARVYRLGGLIRCGVCRRKFDSHWVNGRPGYRCRHGQTSATPASGRQKFVYVREDKLLVHLDTLAGQHGFTDADAVTTQVLVGEYVLYYEGEGVRLEAVTASL